MAFPHQLTKSLLLEYLDSIKGDKSGQHGTAVRGVINLAAQKGLLPGRRPVRHTLPAGPIAPGEEAVVSESIRQLMWQLMAQGILVFGKE